MAVQANTGQQIVIGDYDASCRIKSWQGRMTSEALDTTAICTTSGYREFIGGPIEWGLQASGMLDFAAGGQDEKLGFDKIGSNAAVSFMPTTSGGALGELAYAGKALHVDYQAFGETGQLAPFSLSMVGKGNPLVRGQVMHPTTSARTSSGNGTGYQLGALTAAQSIFLALHVTAISGAPTFAVILESDDNADFTSATTRITSANYSAATGSEWQYLAGAVTDDYWRVRWTVSGGTDPSISFLAVVGIATFP